MHFRKRPAELQPRERDASRPAKTACCAATPIFRARLPTKQLCAPCPHRETSSSHNLTASLAEAGVVAPPPQILFASLMSSRVESLPPKQTLAASLSPEARHMIALAIVSVGVIVPMIFWGVPSALDLSNHFRFALPFNDALRAGHLYPGWLAESNHGFGDASFRFYPPALYYLLAAAKALTGNWYPATVLTFALLSMLGAFGIYLWAREFTSSQNAMWAGIFYALAPYH